MRSIRRVPFLSIGSIEQKAYLGFFQLEQALQSCPADELWRISQPDPPIAISIFLPMHLLPGNKTLDFLQGRRNRARKIGEQPGGMINPVECAGILRKRGYKFKLSVSMEGTIISYPLATVSYYDMNRKILLGSLGIPGMVP